MTRIGPVILDALMVVALTSAFWVLVDEDPSTVQFAASTVGAFLVLEAVRSLRQYVDRRTAQK
ncbi:hypothetical protein ACFY1P_02715 [Streptomyces sp. NPDC001407]|uniref:hypothetical protein n=1 Tax=Streptomyces sp. NPDC001407 TaxID=3364573 RepID=UPI00367F2A13